MVDHSSARRNWVLFLAVSMFMGFASGLYDTSFNNFLNDSYHLSGSARGFLEIPREMPGVSIVLLVALLAFLPEIKVAVLAFGLWAIGVMGLAFFAPSMPLLVFWMILVSAGGHLFLPLNQAIGVSVAGKEGIGHKLGVLGGANTAAAIGGAGLVWLGTRYLGLKYNGIFAISAAFYLLAAITMLGMRGAPRPPRHETVRFTVKRRYTRFYVLSVLYGARKQLFFTFGPWVLVKIFQQSAATIALLWIVASALGAVFRPFLGRLVDRFGERRILMGEAIGLSLICLGYALARAPVPGGSKTGLYLVCACLAADQVFMAVGIARTTYLHKIAEDRRDLTPTLALGISVDHVVSIGAATLGGLVWASFGYQYVFWGAMGLALLNLLAANGIGHTAAEKRFRATASAGGS